MEITEKKRTEEQKRECDRVIVKGTEAIDTMIIAQNKELISYIVKMEKTREQFLNENSRNKTAQQEINEEIDDYLLDAFNSYKFRCAKIERTISEAAHIIINDIYFS